MVWQSEELTTCLIKNKKILSDLLEKEKVYRENDEGKGDDDSNCSDSSDGEELSK